MLIACGACRQVFGIPEVKPIPPDAQALPPDGTHPFPDGATPTSPGLRMHILGGTALWTSPNTSWTATMNHPFAVEDVWLGTSPDQGQLALAGVDPNGAFSVWIEGEVYVDGAQQVQLAARDYAFFSADAFDTGDSYIDVASSAGGMIDTENIPVPAARWYAVRLGWTSSTGNPSLEVLHKSNADPGWVRFNSMNLRH